MGNFTETSLDTRRSTAPRHPSSTRVGALALRAWKQQGIGLVLIPTAIGMLFGVLMVVGTSGMNSLEGAAELIPGQPGALAVVNDAQGNFQPMSTYLLTMSPAILGLVVAISATLSLPGVVADDISGGGIEVLLAGPLPRRALFTAYLGASLMLTAVAWMAATLAFVAGAGATMLVVGSSIHMSWSFLIAELVLPFSLGLWSASATLWGALIYPGGLESKGGMNGGPIRLLAMAPALIAIPPVLLMPTSVLPMLIGILVVSLVASMLMVRFTARSFRSVKVLGT